MNDSHNSSCTPTHRAGSTPPCHADPPHAQRVRSADVALHACMPACLQQDKPHTDAHFVPFGAARGRRAKRRNHGLTPAPAPTLMNECKTVESPPGVHAPRKKESGIGAPFAPRAPACPGMRPHAPASAAFAGRPGALGVFWAVVQFGDPARHRRAAAGAAGSQGRRRSRRAGPNPICNKDRAMHCGRARVCGVHSPATTKVELRTLEQ